MELRHFSLIAAVARGGSLTKAALELHLTQSALSHQLREIETDLGVPVFYRVRQRRMVLTPAGERLLASARIIKREIDAALIDVKALNDGGVGAIRMCMGCYTGYSWLSPLAARFSRIHPKIDISIIAGATHRPVAALLDSEIDLAISTACGDFHPDLDYEPLFQDELVAVLWADHRLATKEFISPSDLREEHLFTYDISDSCLSVFTDYLTPAGITPQKVTRFQLSEAILAMVRAERGITVMAQWAITTELSSKSLVARPLGPNPIVRQWYAITPKAVTKKQYLIDFIELLRSKALPAKVQEKGHARILTRSCA